MRSGYYDQKGSVTARLSQASIQQAQIDYATVEVNDETMISAKILTADYSSICCRFS